jgi:putative heme-binding domain-containing protein
MDELAGTTIVIRTLRHQMRYDLPEFWVTAGKPVSLVFQNNDVMPHNLVVTVPGAMEAVGRAAEALGGGDYVPAHEAVMWHTRLLMPGESERLSFVAPETPGDHPYVCTYPGHWRVMNGVMHVVEQVSADEVIAPRELADLPAPARSFVRDWTLEELAPLLDGDWQAGRSPERGRALFAEAGCIQCHTISGVGATAGPELTAIRDRFQGAELLRHVLEPSLEVADEYRVRIYELDGRPDVSGRLLSDDGEHLSVLPNLLEPDTVVTVPKDEIVETYDTALSPMPSGLLVTFDEEEILDLVSFLQSPSPPEWVTYEGGDGPGRGKHVVLLAGDEEYRSEEALPMLARILAEHHGFRCTVLFSTDPVTGEIDPEEQTHIPGMHLLADADMLVCFLRFRELPDADMAHFVEYVESGKPLLGIRTATHAFAYRRNPDSRFARYDWRSADWPGGFGQQVLGDTWISHHGGHGTQSTRGVIEPGREAHPILRGVDDVWGPTDVYGLRNLGEDATILLRGQVLDGMEPTSGPVAGPQNEPMVPIVWTRELTRGDVTQRVVGSTIGAAVDCESEGLRRVLVNAVYWAAGLEDAIPARSRVDTVGEYAPTNFGFGAHRRGARAVDHALD